MSRIRELIELSNKRREAQDLVTISAKVPRAQLEEVRSLLQKDMISFTRLMHSFLSGYTARHPSILALIDDANRDAVKEEKRAKHRHRDINSIYDEIGDT